MNFTKLQIDELVQYLQGSCETLDEGIITVLGKEYETSDLSNANVHQIDGEIFNCSICGWWFEVAEMSAEESESVCFECHND